MKPGRNAIRNSLLAVFALGSLSIAQSGSDAAFKRFVDSYIKKVQRKEKCPVEVSNITIGDLNMDGKLDAIVDYQVAVGAPGNFTLLYSVVIVDQGAKYKAVQKLDAGSFGGVGFQMQTKEIRDGIAFFDVCEYAESDPVCCPSIQKVKRYKMVKGVMIQK